MTRVVRHVIFMVATGLVGASLVAAPATAAPTWRPVTNLFADLSAAGGSAFTPAIGVDVAGNSTVVWSRWNGTQYVVQASYRPVGGTFGAPVDLAGGRQVVDPQVVVDPAGNATAIWRRVETDRSVVQTASRPAGGTWSTPLDLSTDTSSDLSQRPDVPRLAVDGAGTVTATWSRFEAATDQPWKLTVQSATRATDGTWSAPVDLSPAGSPARTSDVAVDRAGNATAIWVSGALVQAATRPAGGSWGTPADLSTIAGSRANPRIVVDAAGTTTAIWGSFTGTYGIQTASRPLGEKWDDAVSLSGAGTFDTPHVAVDRRGHVTAVWQRHDGSSWIVTSATRAADGTWRGDDLSATGRDAWDPQVAVDPAGNATAVWSSAEKDGRVVQASRRRAGGTWSDPVDLTVGGDAWNPQIGVDPAGNATTAWSRNDGTSWIVQARGLDAAGPVVTEITGATSRISTRGRATYSVTAHDVWSRVASARWTFPDGTTARGTSVSYAGKAGSRPVRVVLTDSVGNATACTYTGTFTCRATTRIAPLIDRARLSTRTIRAVGSDARVAKKAKATIALNTDARVTFTFRKAGGKGKPVTLVKKLDAGRNVVAIRARLTARKVLAPGRWKVVMTAKNKVGTSPKKRFRLRVVR